ncbi:retention module-containing protein [Photobacterium damselae]|uniref:retention module-containing protein n=1 Tax=Photobacterium damselae TaxID=38293 RepID=UPI002542CD2B
MKSFIIHKSGVVKSIHGNAQVNINGHLKSIALMQALPTGSELFMDDSGSVTLQDDAGQQYTIKADTVTPTTNNVLPNDVAEIQSLITSGEDPTKHTQATAAGNVANGGGFGFVDLVRSGEEVLATSGYDSNISRDSSLSERDEEHFIFGEQNHINHRPDTETDTYHIKEDELVHLDLTGNDTDYDGDHVTVSQIDGHTVTPGVEQNIKVNHGHITIAADGDMTFVPNKDFTGTVEIPYTVTDGQGGSASSTATITVTPVNDAPVANPETETTPEDKTIKVDFTGNDSDVDGDHVTVSEINGHAVTPNTAQTIEVKHGHITITADGEMSFVPTKDFTGTVEIPYTVTDGQGGSATSTATITVTPVNDAPVANPETETTPEDKTIKVDFAGNDSDVDGDHVTVSEINGHAVTPNTAQTIEVKHGHITITADGEMSFVPNKDFTGQVEIPYTVTDGQGGSATSTATITVTPVNDAPVANPEAETTPEDKTIKVDFAGNDSDVDGDHVTVSQIDGHTVTPNTAQTIEVKHGHITIAADGAMSFVPNKDFTGTVEIPYTVTDGQGGSASSTATITVTPVNDAPVANPDTATTPEDKTIKVDFAGNDSDVDGDHVTVSEINGHAVTPNTAQTIEVKHGHITITADGEMSFVPNKDFTGQVEIPYTVTDGQGGSATSTATITVTPVNDAPVANPETVTTSEDKTIKVDFAGNDSDVDGDHVTVSQIDGHTVTPGVEQTIKVNHGHITIAADGDMTFVPNKDFTGTVEIPYTVTDGQGGSASSTATITVTPVNDAPVANPDTATTPEDKTIKVDFAGNDSDVDGDHVTVSEINGHAVTPNTAQTIEVKHGHITIAADGEMTFVPTKDFTGTVEIPYTVTDGQGGSATSTATITVTPVNDAPVANPETETTPEDKTIKVDFAGNDSDVDGDHVTVSEINGHAVTPNTAQTIEVKHGHITITADGDMSFVPNKDFTGTVEIPYTVTDGQGGSASSTATITVTPVNDAPVANPETETTPEDKTIKVDFTGNDSDVDGDHVTVSQIDGHTVTPGVEQTIKVNHGHIAITADGDMSFVPTKDFTGTVEIPYTVTDGQGGSATSTATITVTPVNDAPVANPDTATTQEDSAIKVNFAGNDSDVDGDHVTVSEINGHAVTPNTAQTIEVKHGHITIAADGEMSFVPNKDFTGTVEIPYTVTDGQGGSASSTATITVTPVNDAPVANPETETTPEDKTIKVDFAGNDSDVDGDHVTVSQIDGHTVTPGVEQTIKVNHGHITLRDPLIISPKRNHV